MTYLPYWLAALHLPDIGPRTFLPWLQAFPNIKALFLASSDELRTLGIPAKHIHSLHHVDWTVIEKELNWVQSNRHIITFEDERYPPLLKEIPDPPLVLYVRGNPLVLSKKQIAIVGSRHATPAGLKNAEHFAYVLAEAGFVVTSGLALGVDGASHRGVLAANGETIGVCGTGLSQIYPRSHQALAEEMTVNGAVVSEFPLDMKPHAANFPRRNRIIGGLSSGVLVVEAALKSGSLITARHALEQGREVFAIPGSIHNPLTRGCHHLIRQGAKLVETVADIFEELGAQVTMKPSPAATRLNDLTQAQRGLLAQIEYEITPLDMILLRSRLTAGEVSSILLILELNGYIQSVSGGYVRAILNQ